MAGDWLKVEHATLDKPEIFELADLLNLDPEIVFAKVVRVWIWFDQHSIDGTAPLTLAALLDRQVGVQGFTKALREVNWIGTKKVGRKKVLYLPNFDRHVGESAKKRALTARRVAKCKAKSNAETNAGDVKEVTEGALPNALPREEKRRDSTSIRNVVGKVKTVQGDEAPEKERADDDSKEPKSSADYSNWIPTDNTIKRLKKALPGITEKFIQDDIPEFLSYAESKYRADQLQAKFYANVERHFKQQAKPEHQSKAPKRTNNIWVEQPNGGSHLLDPDGKILQVVPPGNLDDLVNKGVEAQQT